MANNISKYVQLNSFLLLEYEFNKDETKLDLSSIGSKVGISKLGNKEYWNDYGEGTTNNSLKLNSIPIVSNRSTWYINPVDTSAYAIYFDSSTQIVQSEYEFDTVKIHIVSGYNFDDVAGFLLQIKALDTSNNYVDLTNFTWVKQLADPSNVIKFSSNALYLGNKFYDKYIILRIPSIGNLGGDNLSNIGEALNIKALSDVFINYSTITDINVNNQYIINENIAVQLPVTSVADNFNIYIAESTVGDFIEYYATWNDLIIGEYMGDIESGRIRLYTSNNPNDNYAEFVSQYGFGAAKWALIHEIYVYENIPSPGGGSSLLAQKFSFTQADNFNSPNYFRPVLNNADIAASYTIQYVCRLMNRMDGSQIIRQASFASTDPKKYGSAFTRISIENFIPYKVFNRISSDKANIVAANTTIKTKYSKVFVDTTNIAIVDDNTNTIYPQGTGPLFLKNTDGVYSFNFDKYKFNTDGTVDQKNIDLSGAYNYALEFILDDGNKISIPPTYSQNMNSTLGILEFKIKGDQTQTLINQSKNDFSVVILNPDGTSYTYYQGKYYAFSNYTEVVKQYTSLYNATTLNDEMNALRAENADLKNQISQLQNQISS